MDPEVWESLSEKIRKNWENMTPEQRQQTIAEYDRRMNPSPDALRNAQDRIDDAIQRSQGPVMRQGHPAQAGCLPNDREVRRPNPGCGLTTGGMQNNVAVGLPIPGTAIYFCRHYVIGGVCTEQCTFERCRAAGEP
jgi:hypothetical protein